MTKLVARKLVARKLVAKSIKKGSSSRPLPKATRRENFLLAVKAKVSSTVKREAKVMGSEASQPIVLKKSLPYASRINLLFKPTSPRKLHESDLHLLRPCPPPKKLDLCL